MNFIIDPSNNQSYSIFSKQGKYLLKTYVSLYQSGGADRGGGADGGGGASADEKEVESMKRVLGKNSLPEKARYLLAKTLLGHKTQNQPENKDHLKIVNAFSKNNPFFGIVSNIINIPLTSRVIDLIEIISNIITDNPKIIDKLKGAPKNYGSIKIVDPQKNSNTDKEGGGGKLLGRDDILGVHFKSGDEVAVVITDIENNYAPFVDDIFDFIVKISKEYTLQKDIGLFLDYEVEDTDNNRTKLSSVIEYLKSVENVEEPLWDKFYDSLYFELEGEDLHNFIVNLFKPNLPYWERFSKLWKSFSED